MNGAQVVAADEVKVAGVEPLPGRPGGDRRIGQRSADAVEAGHQGDRQARRKQHVGHGDGFEGARVVIDHRRTHEAGRGADAEEVPGRVHMGLAEAGHRRAGSRKLKAVRARRGACGQHHFIGGGVFDLPHLHRRVEMDAGAQGIHLVGQPADDGAHIGAVGRAGGDGHLPAQPLGGFVQFNVVPPQGCGTGELQPRRTAAHHENPLRLGCPVLRIDAELVLLGGGVVDDAANLAAGHQLADAAHVGADAGADAMLLGITRLVHQVGVSDQRPHHGYHLCGAAGDDVLGVVEGHDAAHHHDRAVQSGRDDLVGGHFHAERVIRRGDQLVKPPIGAHVQGDVVRLGVDGGGDAGAVGGGDAARHMVFVGQPHAHCELAARHRLAHRGDDLVEEPQAVLEGAAVAVAALVEGGGKEFVQQVAA